MVAFAIPQMFSWLILHIKYYSESLRQIVKDLVGQIACLCRKCATRYIIKVEAKGKKHKF